MKVLVVGAGGQLGAAIVHEIRPRSVVVPVGHGELDITDEAAVGARVAAEQPDAIVNCAAYNDVDGAESHPVTALQVNALGVRALARAAARSGAALVHYSTDFVFDGTAGRPYREDDRPNPQSVYAMSKLVGEWFAADVPHHYVLRVESLFGGAPGGPVRGSAENICARIRRGERTPVFVDRTVSPTYVGDAAAATWRILELGLASGTYHCVNSGRCTWQEFAEEAAHVIGRTPELAPIRLDDVKLAAPRPKYCALSNERLARLGVAIPDWRDALQRTLAARPGAPD